MSGMISWLGHSSLSSGFHCSSRGQLGNGGIENIEEPQIIQELEGLSVVAIAAGGWHSAAVSGKSYNTIKPLQVEGF